MWADHYQLQVPSNHFNTKVQALMIDENGDGSLLQKHIRPHPDLAPYSFLPFTGADGTVLDVSDVWLIYTGGKHYNHPLITEGTLADRGVFYNQDEMYIEKVDKHITKGTEINVMVVS